MCAGPAKDRGSGSRSRTPPCSSAGHPAGESGHYDGLQDALALEGREQLHFSDFYGLALPPLYDGQRVCPVQLENVIDTPDALDDVDVLVLSYDSRSRWRPASITRSPDGSAAVAVCCTSATAPIRITRSAPGGPAATTPAPTTWPRRSARIATATASSRSVRAGFASFRPGRPASPNHRNAPPSWSRRSASWPKRAATPGSPPTGCRCSVVRTSSEPCWRRPAARMSSRAGTSICSTRSWASSGSGS